MANKSINKAVIISLSVGAVAVVAIVVILIVLLKKKKSTSNSLVASSTSSSVSAYEFPIDTEEHIIFNENFNTGTTSVLSNDAGVGLRDSNWCNALSQRWIFEFVQNGGTPDVKVYRLRIGSNYLTYDSANATTLTMVALANAEPASSNQLWAIKNLPGVTPVRIYTGNSAVTIGVFNILNVGSGLSLTYDPASSNPILAGTATVNSSDQKQKWSIHQNVCSQ
jgi:hypothetical protein